MKHTMFGKCFRLAILLSMALFLLPACSGKAGVQKTSDLALSELSVAEESEKKEEQTEESVDIQEEESVDIQEEENVEPQPEENVEPQTEETEDNQKKKTETKKEPDKANGFVIVIDPGHQEYGNRNLEPDGPGSSNMKAKVTGGTSGISSGVPEYKLTLSVAKYLKKELKKRGYEVIMTRESHDVDLSNSERAQIANEAEADAFIRIHADGSDDSSAEGIMTICQTAANPYNGDLYEKSKALSESVLNHMVERTGAACRYVWETDTMSGINWASVPVTIVEMGFMTNPVEDELMETKDYQKKMAEGMADGIDDFLGL